MSVKRKPRIAVMGLKGLPAFGGAATVGENLIEQLKNEFDFTVYAVETHAGKVTEDQGFRQIVFKKSRVKSLNTFLYFVKSLLHVLFIGKYDFIHVHHYSSGFMMPFLRMKYKILVTLHGIYADQYYDYKFSRLTNFLLKRTQYLTFKLANKIVSVAAYDAINLSAKYNLDIRFIPNGVKQVPIERNEASEDYITFSAGRIYQVKGLHILLQAMHKNKDKRKLLVIGSLEHVQSYKEEIYKMAEGLNVTFIPLIKDKSELLKIISKSRYFVFPSTHEAMAMMLLEVTSINVPVIAGDLVANTAVFSEEEVLYFKSGDADSLASQMNYAELNMDDMRARADKAHKKVRTEYSWETIAASYAKIYQAMLNEI